MNAITAPDGRPWLEWAADYHAEQANQFQEMSNAAALKYERERLDELAAQHTAMAQACREAMG